MVLYMGINGEKKLMVNYIVINGVKNDPIMRL